MRFSLAGSPISGVLSSFQSPVWNTWPCGVRIASAEGSGIECAMVTNSQPKGPTSNLALSGISVIGIFSRPPYSDSLAFMKAAVKGVANTGHLSRGHSSIMAPT